MASSPSFALALAVEDSPTESGQKSVVSAKISHAYDAFLDELLQVLRYPVQPEHAPAFKEVQVTEGESPDDLSVKVILDGAKSPVPDPTGAKRDGVAISWKIKANRAGRSLEHLMYAPHFVGDTGDTLFSTAHTKFLDDPFRLEAWWVMPGGERKADDEVIQSVMPALESVMRNLAREVKVTADAEKQAFVTGPMREGITTYEKLFDACIDNIKAFQNPTVEVLSEAKLKLTVPSAPTYTLLDYDKDAGTINSTTWTTDAAQKQWEWAYTFTKSPLEMQIKIEAFGEVQLSEAIKLGAQAAIDYAIAKATAT